MKLVSAHSRMEIESKKKGPAASTAPEGKRASGVGRRDLHVRDGLSSSFNEEGFSRGETSLEGVRKREESTDKAASSESDFEEDEPTAKRGPRLQWRGQQV